MTILEYFRILAPQFAGMSDVAVNQLITMAGLFVNVSCLDTERANAATSLYAAHLAWTVDQSASGGGSVGNIKSEREGDLSRTYGSLVGDDTWIGQSPYGLQYLDITKVCSGSGIMTRFGDSPPVLDYSVLTGFLSGYGLAP